MEVAKFDVTSVPRPSIMGSGDSNRAIHFLGLEQPIGEPETRSAPSSGLNRLKGVNVGLLLSFPRSGH